MKKHTSQSQQAVKGDSILNVVHAELRFHRGNNICKHPGI